MLVRRGPFLVLSVLQHPLGQPSQGAVCGWERGWERQEEGVTGPLKNKPRNALVEAGLHLLHAAPTLNHRGPCTVWGLGLGHSLGLPAAAGECILDVWLGPWLSVRCRGGAAGTRQGDAASAHSASLMPPPFCDSQQHRSPAVRRAEREVLSKTRAKVAGSLRRGGTGGRGRAGPSPPPSGLFRGARAPADRGQEGGLLRGVPGCQSQVCKAPWPLREIWGVLFCSFSPHFELPH